MSKVVMLIDALQRYPDHEWVVWMDDDTWINPGFLDLPLELYLQDVPPHKIFVQSNYRSQFTNLYFWRNSEKGRALAYDWLAVSMSGYIQCHGFDQAALQMLALQRLRGTFHPNPLGMSCIWTYDSNLGCHEKGDYSCDFDFEAALYKSGYKSKSSGFHNGMISSYSKGCANDYFPEFHVVTETISRPRLQCCYCYYLDYIEADHCFDGPLCGGNDWLRRGAVNGWFANHKQWWFFFETYLNPNNCKALPYTEFVPPCKPEKITAFLQDPRAAGKGLISLSHGFLYDLDEVSPSPGEGREREREREGAGGGGYCYSSSSALQMYQKKTSYMKYTDEVISALKNCKKPYDWRKAYDDEVQRMTARKCTGTIANQCHEGRRVRPLSHDFEKEGYCESACKKKENVLLEGLDQGERYAMECVK
eukprot:CAMPEP_0182416288 /NCGR_PEP_ID=MMETSP1167-20130531/561_1 /TAXON_ID=2988 /ORGANISM="Mallomonas Sp, Strain CCMP3275" /LENGTH=419 /DNA_ID=CAMNT_0024588929 /DNA_START=1042 /DNA_END=2301 /DNA_ORIENTATION=-